MLLERGQQLAPRSSCSRRSRCATARSRIARDLLERRHPVGAAGGQRRLDLVVQAGHPDHVELVEVVLVDRAELDPLEQRHDRVLGELQDPVVEVHPRDLAVEVEGAGRRGRDRARRRPRRRSARSSRISCLGVLGARLHSLHHCRGTVPAARLRSGERPGVAAPGLPRQAAVSGLPGRRRARFAEGHLARRCERDRVPVGRAARARRAQLRSRAAASAAADEAARNVGLVGEAHELGGDLLGGRASQSIPLRPSSIRSAGPPSRTAITGTPLACASTTTCP